MKYVEDKWINFVPRRYSKKFSSLSDLAKYIYKNGICYMSILHRYILHQLTRQECQILNAKICAMYKKYYNEKV